MPETKIEYKLVPRLDKCGGTELALIKYVAIPGSDNIIDEELCTMRELEELFETCQTRWQVHGWDLNKLETAIRECDFD